MGAGMSIGDKSPSLTMSAVSSLLERTAQCTQRRGPFRSRGPGRRLIVFLSALYRRGIRTRPPVIFCRKSGRFILQTQMNSLPHPQPKQRAPRVHPEGVTPAVFRLNNGNRVAGKLQVLSVTGGLLCVPRPVQQGSRGKLMFLTGSGSVLAGAEMLSPVSWGLQPFRFLALAADDQDRLKTVIQTSLERRRRDEKRNLRAHVEIEKNRPW